MLLMKDFIKLCNFNLFLEIFIKCNSIVKFFSYIFILDQHLRKRFA